MYSEVVPALIIRVRGRVRVQVRGRDRVRARDPIRVQRGGARLGHAADDEVRQADVLVVEEEGEAARVESRIRAAGGGWL